MFHWVSAYCVNPLDALCNGWYLLDIIGHPLLALFAVELGMGMVGMVGRMGWVSGPVDGVAYIVRLLYLVGEGYCPESRFVTCSSEKRGGVGDLFLCHCGYGW